MYIECLFCVGNPANLKYLEAVNVKDTNGLFLLVWHLDAIIDAADKPGEQATVQCLAERVSRVARLPH